jgi:chloramphenicol O-acetyltransferase type A
VKFIDVDTWERRQQFKLFSSYTTPHFSLTVCPDITGFMRIAKAEKFSLFNAVLFAIMKATNSIPEFRTRFEGEKIIQHELVHPSYTVPIANDHFAFCEAEYSPDWHVFNANCNIATEQGKSQVQLTDNTAGTNHWIYLSCMPWLYFTAIQHPVLDAKDCMPRIAWGKIEERDGKWRMPVNLQAHHAFMDGLHAAKFFKRVEENLENFLQ